MGQKSRVQCGPAGFFPNSLPRLVWGCAVGHVCFPGMDPLPGSLWLRAEFGFLQSWDRGYPFLADCWPGAGPCCIPSCAFYFACVFLSTLGSNAWCPSYTLGFSDISERNCSVFKILYDLVSLDDTGWCLYFKVCNLNHISKITSAT